MKLKKRSTSLVLFGLGMVLFTIVMGLIAGIEFHSAKLAALASSTTDGLHPLQNDINDNTWAIIGLAIAGMLAISVPGTAAAMGMSTTSSAALGAITERPEIFGKTVLYVVFIEAIAIYGFVIAFLLTGYIPSLLG